MECYNDGEVFHALITSDRGLGKAERDGQACRTHWVSQIRTRRDFRLEGFEYPQFITSANNSPYMNKLVEDEGYIKKIDLVNYLGDITEGIPPGL